MLFGSFHQQYFKRMFLIVVFTAHTLFSVSNSLVQSFQIILKARLTVWAFSLNSWTFLFKVSLLDWNTLCPNVRWQSCRGAWDYSHDPGLGRSWMNNLNPRSCWVVAGHGQLSLFAVTLFICCVPQWLWVVFFFDGEVPGKSGNHFIESCRLQV